MNTDPENRFQELVHEKLDGKSYTEIRKELKESGMNEADISRLIRQVDEKVLNETVKKAGQNSAQQWYRLGLILSILGLILSIAYSRGIILANLPALLIYSPFFAGILVMIYGRTLQRKSSGLTNRGPGAIRRRRPYK